MFINIFCLPKHPPKDPPQPRRPPESHVNIFIKKYFHDGKTKMTVVRTKPELWESIKKEMMATTCKGKWSARCAQLCVLEYKKRGGGYIGQK